VKSLVQLLGRRDLKGLAGRHDFISIGPQTSAAIRLHGGKIAAEACRHDMAGLKEAILDRYR
jgi:uroporphyrinogen-III synthase